MIMRIGRNAISLTSLIIIGIVLSFGCGKTVTEKKSEAEFNLKLLGMALETYYTDNNAYPLAVDKNGKPVQPNRNGISIGYAPNALTTPIAHLSSLPQDPFSHYEGQDTRGRYQYITYPLSSWALISPGPNEKVDSSVNNITKKNLWQTQAWRVADDIVIAGP